MVPVLGEPRALEAAAVMLLFSGYLLVEGITRTNLNEVPPAGSTFTGTHDVFPPIVSLVSAVGEIIFGFAGLVVAFFVIAHKNVSAPVLMATMALELVFGWFVFTVFVLAMPSFAAARLAAPMPNLNLTQSRAVIIMGLLGSVAECAAMQGAQFMMTNILFIFVSGKGKAQTGSLYRLRLYVFAFLVLLKGVSELVIACILRQHNGPGQLAAPNVQPPYAVTRPDLLVADGVQVSLVGLFGLAMAAFNLKGLSVLFSAVSFFSLLVQIALFDVGSVGVGGPMVIPVGALQVGLTVAVMFLPAYLAAHLGDEEYAAGGKASDSAAVNGHNGHSRQAVPDGAEPGHNHV